MHRGLVRQVSWWVDWLGEASLHVMQQIIAKVARPLISHHDRPIDVPRVAIYGQVTRLKILNLGVDIDKFFATLQERQHLLENALGERPCLLKRVLHRGPTEGDEIALYLVLGWDAQLFYDLIMIWKRRLKLSEGRLLMLPILDQRAWPDLRFFK